jgi:hypothetical protein
LTGVPATLGNCDVEVSLEAVESEVRPGTLIAFALIAFPMLSVTNGVLRRGQDATVGQDRARLKLPTKQAAWAHLSRKRVSTVNPIQFAILLAFLLMYVAVAFMVVVRLLSKIRPTKPDALLLGRSSEPYPK